MLFSLTEADKQTCDVTPCLHRTCHNHEAICTRTFVSVTHHAAPHAV